MRSRAGFLLAEALCALALAALLAVACATALGGVRRATLAAEARARAERGGRDALQVISALARDADSLLILGDTALELTIRIASGVICARDSLSLTLPPAEVTGGAAIVVRAQPVEAGDELSILVRDPLATARWERAPIDSVSERSGETPCGPGGGFVAAADAGAGRLRLVPSSLGAGVGAGAAVRVGRRGRLVLYNAGRGEWMLGWRRCIAGVCGVVQPVAGPLRTPAAGGLLIEDAGAGGLRLRVRVPGVAGEMEALVTRTDVGR